MSPGQTYRATCEHCGHFFFAPSKGATVCPRCVKKWGRDATGRRGDGGTRRPGKGDLGSGLSRPVSPSPRPPVSESAPSLVLSSPAPLAVEVTEEGRAAIGQRFEALRGAGGTVRAINGQIAREMGIRRDRVAEVTEEYLRAEASAALSTEQRNAVIAAYRGYVERGERPEGGRRAAIARHLGLSRGAVERVVHEFNVAATAGDVTDRVTRFRIETAYWRLAREASLPLPAMWDAIAGEVGVTPWQAARWIDMIQEDPETLSATEPATAEQAAAIAAAYEAYLAGPAPPDEPLHAAIAAAVGVTPKQAHRALLEYRWAQCRALRPAHV